MRRVCLLVFLCLDIPLAWAADPLLEAANVGTTARIPSVQRPVTYTLRLRAPAAADVRGRYVAALAVDGRIVASQAMDLSLAAGTKQDVPLSWTPAQDGWRTLVFSLRRVGAKKPCVLVTKRVPVTARPLYFVWFGAPRHFHWCNVPTTVQEREWEQWLWLGAIPCAWRGGVCYGEWPLEKFVENYRSSPWIAIDEVGPLDEVGQKILSAVRAHKQAHPQGFRLLWYMGVHDYWRDYRDCVDLFVPEIYLNYRGNHLGQLDSYIRATRRLGLMDQMIPGLGVNIIYDKNKQPIWRPTKEYVLRQILYLKRIAPELAGVGFFSTDTGPKIGEYCDELCRLYYINPVLTLLPETLQAKAQRGGNVELAIRLRNCGGMTARAGALEFFGGPPGSEKRLAQQALPALPAGQEMSLRHVFSATPGLNRYLVRLTAGADHTLLDAEASTFVLRRPAQDGPVFWQPNITPADLALPFFAPQPASSPQWNRVALLNSRGQPTAFAPTVILPRLPDEPQGLLAWLAPDRTRSGVGVFQFSLAKKSSPKKEPLPLSWEQTGSRLTVRAASYTALLDTAQDALLSLRPAGGSVELLGSPWRFSCTAYEGFGPPTLTETPLGLSVTIPFANSQAEGFSRYFFFGPAPVIRVQRWLVPRAPLTLTQSSEGCTMPQRGGVYALQPGLGGELSRGTLQDSAEYRDLLFGYLGGSPSPENDRLAGWIDLSFPQDGGGGLGVAIERRWADAYSSVGYDVTRYYDGGDWLQILNLWGKECRIARPQALTIYLLPHGPLPLDKADCLAPAQILWTHLHNTARPVPLTP